MTVEQSLKHWVNSWPERARRLLTDVQVEFKKATIEGRRGKILSCWRTWSDLAMLLRRVGIQAEDPPSLAEIRVPTRGERGKCGTTKHQS